MGGQHGGIVLDPRSFSTTGCLYYLLTNRLDNVEKWSENPELPRDLNPRTLQYKAEGTWGLTLQHTFVGRRIKPSGG